ncbi:MAG: GerW family sporulation protein [Oscillospiraceae bacterium]
MANGEHPINGLMNVTLEKIRQMVDSNTIIGNPIVTADGTTILPVSRVSFGFASGGSDFVSSKAPKDLFGGGSSAGVSITPIAFLVLKDGNVRLLQLAEKSGGTLDRALNMMPEVLDKVSSLIGKDKTKGKAQAAAEPEQNQPEEPEEPLL